MFSEQYRRDNEKLHAKETLLMGIENQIKEEERQAKHRARFVRYGAIAAAVVLVFAGVLGVVFSRGTGGKLSLSSGNTDAEAVIIADEAGSQEAAVLSAIADAVEEEAPAAAEVPTLSSENGSAETVTSPESYDALYALMDTSAYASRKGVMLASGGVADNAAVMESAASEPTASADMGGAGGVDHSATNVQVEGVDEADIVKTDGAFIYYIGNDRLAILKADGANTAPVSVTPLGNDGEWWGFASEMYVQGDTLLLITQGMRVISVVDGGAHYEDNRDETQVRVYDISDRTAPKLINTFAQSGSYISSRMVGTVAYITTTQYIWQPVRTQPSTFVPETRVGDVATILPAADILIYGRPQNTAYTVIGAIDLADTRAYAGVKAVFGGTGELYCSGKNLLLACSEYDEEKSDIAPDESGRNVQVTTSRSQTKLMLFSLESGKITFTASGIVPGTLLNQFAMDEYNGVFRVVTSVYNWTQRIYTDGVDTYEYEDSTTNGLYTFDGQLQLLGKIDDLAEDETVQSVRFDGDIAYFVTFRQIDPLFTVDLHNPKSPKVLSALKIPGFSEYLHVYGKGLLVGLGYAADEKTGSTQGVKLSMFDTAQPADVRELHTARVDADWSVVGNNHKAILVDVEKNLIAFPADNAYYIYSYTREDGFTQLAKVLMQEDLYSWNLRGLFVGEYFYVLSDNRVSVISMADWKTVFSNAF